MIRILVSACLVGHKVRYDGRHALNFFIRDVLGRNFVLIPVCPETECGMGIPREPLCLSRDKTRLRLISLNTNRDLTGPFTNWAEGKLEELSSAGIHGAILKSRSPSCGIRDTLIVDERRRKTRGMGLFARLLKEKFPSLPLEDDVLIARPSMLESFVFRIFIHKKWSDLMNEGSSVELLREFHARYRLIIKSLSPGEMVQLEKALDGEKDRNGEEIVIGYGKILKEVMNCNITRARCARAIKEIFKSVKGKISPEEQRIIYHAVEAFRKKEIPQYALLTLMEYFALNCDGFPRDGWGYLEAMKEVSKIFC